MWKDKLARDYLLLFTLFLSNYFLVGNGIKLYDAEIVLFTYYRTPGYTGHPVAFPHVYTIVALKKYILKLVLL